MADLTVNMTGLDRNAGSAAADLTVNMTELGLLARSAGSSVSEEVASVTMVFEGDNVLSAGVARDVNTE